MRFPQSNKVNSVKKRLVYGFLMVALVLGVLAIFWPFNPGKVHPATVDQTLVFWAFLSAIFLLIVTFALVILALALRPNDAETRCNRGIALYKLKRFDDALAD